jgi:hypothetical protein
LPVFYFFTIAFNTFAITYEGSSYLGFDKWSLAEVLLASTISGLVVATLVQVFFVKRLRQSITSKNLLHFI